MSRIKRANSSAALTVAVVALVAALGGGAVAGVSISKLDKKEKKQVKRISKKQARKLDKRIELLPGPKGDPGQDAVALFAYVRDPGVNADAQVEFASGATPVSVDDNPNVGGSYQVSFNRPNLSGCVVHVTLGGGDPIGGNAVTTFSGSASALVVQGTGTVSVSTASASGNPADTSFMLSVFC